MEEGIEKRPRMVRRTRSADDESGNDLLLMRDSTRRMARHSTSCARTHIERTKQKKNIAHRSHSLDGDWTGNDDYDSDGDQSISSFSLLLQSSHHSREDSAISTPQRPSRSKSFLRTASSDVAASSSSSKSFYYAFLMVCGVFIVLLGSRSLSHVKILLTSSSQYKSPKDVESSSTATSSQNTTISSVLQQPDGHHFCRVPQVELNDKKVGLLYQCTGRPYDMFVEEMYSYVRNISSLASISSTLTNQSAGPGSWGQRDFPVPAGKSVLLLGNSHLRQVSKTLLCQYANQISYSKLFRGDSFILKFTNNATWISITNTVLVYSPNWLQWIEEEFLLQHLDEEDPNDEQEPNIEETSSTVDQMNALIFGKFTSYKEALHTNFEHMMKEEEQYYKKKRGGDDVMPSIQQSNKSVVSTDSNNPNNYQHHYNTDVDNLSFQNFSPPTLSDAAEHFHNPIIAVSMFSRTDVSRFQASRRDYYEKQQQMQNQRQCYLEPNDDKNTIKQQMQLCNRTNVYFVNSRKYVDEIGLECGSDDKLVTGTCHEPGDIIPNSNRNPSDMHRCAGQYGGHADLIAWDLVETLYEIL